MELQNTTKCDACSKTLLKKDSRYLRLKTCCSYKQVPVCTDCWNKLKNMNEQ